MRRIRTPFQPDPVREVTESEYTDLSRQGLVLEDLTPAPQRTKKTTAGEPGATTKES